MKINTLTKFLAMACVAVSCNGAGPVEAPSLIPLPAEISVNEGGLNLNRRITANLGAQADESIFQAFSHLIPALMEVSGKAVKMTEGKALINFSLNSSIASEGYTLEVSPKGIDIQASTSAGLFYAVQTLNQIIGESSNGSIAAVSIADEPRYGWRGFMLDEGRHIFGVDEVKKVLDMMASQKLNRFHWHLTEDQGWRIEIKKYPKLTEVGAWRSSNSLAWRDQITTDDEYYGGFYTQDQIKEIVAYAKDRFIEVIPEIDIPGHTQAAVAAYPEILACDPQNPHEVWLSQGVSDDVMNVANPAAVQFAKDVIDELIPLFPYPYLHLGGDECPTDKWQKNALCQSQLKQIGSKNFRDLQLNFYGELVKHLSSKPEADQRKLIFWNEVLHGNTDLIGDKNNMTIMAWVGADQAALDAASRGMTTILSPQIPYYINRKQSNLPDEPMSQGRGTETVERVYSYVPANNVPEELQPYYMGVQANFWSEWVKEASFLEYLMQPRLAAVAEAAWTPQDLRSYDSFVSRVIALSPTWDKAGWTYAKHIFPEE